MARRIDWQWFEGACTDPKEVPGRGVVREHLVQWKLDARARAVGHHGPTAVRFFMDESPSGAVKIDYELLDPRVSDEDARRLIARAYFVGFTGDHYRGKVTAFDFGRADEPRVVEAYPDA